MIATMIGLVSVCSGVCVCVCVCVLCVCIFGVCLVCIVCVYLVCVCGKRDAKGIGECLVM